MFHLLAATTMTFELMLTRIQLHSMDHQLIKLGCCLLAGSLAAVSTD